MSCVKTTNMSLCRLHRVVLIRRAMSWALFLPGGKVWVLNKYRKWKSCAGFRMAQGSFQDKVKQQRIVVIDFIEGIPFFRVDMN